MTRPSRNADLAQPPSTEPQPAGLWVSLKAQGARSRRWEKVVNILTTASRPVTETRTVAVVFISPFSMVTVQPLSRLQLSATPWTAARQASLSFTISRSLLRLESVESMMPFSHLTLRCPLLLLPFCCITEPNKLGFAHLRAVEPVY